ncbi:MAG: SMC-Scp complex subunit ScpB [Acidobacteriaceae bacterium]|jgi:segregation and condensation protein B
MSLKAKIEAVIYASEEPVTLTQLVGLLGEEAQAELAREAANQRALLEDEELEAAEEEPTLGEDFDSVGGDGDGNAMLAEEVVQSTQDGEVVLNGAPDAVAGDAAAATKAEKARAARLRTYFRAVLDELVAEYAGAERGLEIREVAGGFRFGTKPEYHDAVRGFVKSLKPPLKLTLQALETLAVVAYKQPVTAPEISEIRGVDSSGVLGSLLARKLITTAGRKHVIGRPILYKTTREFLLKFGLKDVAELPSIEEFEKMAGQLAEQEEIPMESEDRESPQEVEERLESDGEAPAPAPVADEVIVDGRLSGLPPKYDDAEDDPSAAEAEIQSGEGS